MLSEAAHRGAPWRDPRWRTACQRCRRELKGATRVPVRRQGGRARFGNLRSRRCVTATTDTASRAAGLPVRHRPGPVAWTFWWTGAGLCIAGTLFLWGLVLFSGDPIDAAFVIVFLMPLVFLGLLAACAVNLIPGLDVGTDGVSVVYPWGRRARSWDRLGSVVVSVAPGNPSGEIAGAVGGALAAGAVWVLSGSKWPDPESIAAQMRTGVHEDLDEEVLPHVDLRETDGRRFTFVRLRYGWNVICALAQECESRGIEFRVQ